jgi:hypothetical protein
MYMLVAADCQSRYRGRFGARQIDCRSRFYKYGSAEELAMIMDLGTGEHAFYT